jgi:hypothetical protein
MESRMSFRTNPDRILDSIDRARNRDIEGGPDYAREASGRELDSEAPEPGSTPTERARRIFRIVEKGYMGAAQSADIRKLASRFQTIGDIPNQHARGDVSVSIQYLDSPRGDDVGMVPYEIFPSHFEEAKKVTRTSRPDANALKILRDELRKGVMAAYRKVEPRVRDAVRERADIGHVAVQVTIDLRSGERPGETPGE